VSSDSDQLDLFGVPAAPKTAKPTTRRAPPALAAAALAPDLATVAEQWPPSIRLGTSSWSFPGWEGIVYDGAASEQRLAREGLAAYAQNPLLRTVGIDRTFYAPLAVDTFAAYAAAVPPDFRFLVKAHQLCTTARWGDQPGYASRRGQANDRFLDPVYAAEEIVGPCMVGLGDTLGPLLFQFPPQPLGELSSAPHFAERLYAFLEKLPRGPLYAIELRNAELLTSEYGQALRAARACHCLNVHPTMPSLRVQAKMALDAETPALIVRWMLHGGFRYEEAKQRYAPFNQIVDEDPASRRDIADLCRRALRRAKPAFVVINNKAEGSAPLSAFRLAQAIAEEEPAPRPRRG